MAGWTDDIHIRCQIHILISSSKVNLIKKGIHAAEDEDPGFIQLSALCESSTATTKTAIDSNSTRTRESPTVRTQDSNSNSTEIQICLSLKYSYVCMYAIMFLFHIFIILK